MSRTGLLSMTFCRPNCNVVSTNSILSQHINETAVRNKVNGNAHIFYPRGCPSAAVSDCRLVWRFFACPWHDKCSPIYTGFAWEICQGALSLCSLLVHSFRNLERAKLSGHSPFRWMKENLSAAYPLTTFLLDGVARQLQRLLSTSCSFCDC